MAISIATLFARLGKIIKTYNANLALQGTTLLGSGSGADEILDEYNARRDLVPTCQQDFTGMAGAVAGWNSRLKSYADATLADLQADLDAPSSSPSTILPLLAQHMVGTSDTINASTISTPTYSAGGSNAGNGTLVLSKKNLAGVDDERIISEVLAMTCITDAPSLSATAGSESFSLVGYPKFNNVNAYGTLGSGVGPTIVCGDNSNLLTNGTFETWTVTNVPDNWTPVGTVTTNYLRVATPHRGTYGLALKSNASAATISMTQSIASVVKTQTIYALGVWLRRSGSLTGSSVIQVRVTGTSFSTVFAINANPTSLTTSYAFYSVVFPTGLTIPSDLSVCVEWGTVGAISSGDQIFVDDIVLQPMTAFSHVQYALFSGTDAGNWIKGDTLTVTTAKSASGVFQDFFSRVYDVALPSDAAASETISDSLAT